MMGITTHDNDNRQVATHKETREITNKNKNEEQTNIEITCNSMDNNESQKNMRQRILMLVKNK